ncbi:MAG: hypothetical protein KDC13_05840 [Bacteroidetes bacterium]|nr:hypothetical protein [Bacteroidota bacterium]
MQKSMRCLFVLMLVLLAGSVGNRLFAQDLSQIGKGKAVRMSGTMSLQGGPYIYLGDGQARNEPFWWMAQGNPVLSIYGWQLPFSFSVGSQHRAFNQPFNRFGVSPFYKWATFHFGYRSMRFNPYVMSGLQFLGAGVELNPKGFRFAAFYGRFAKPVRQDTLASITPDPAYRRMGYGVKVGAGSRRNYVDLMLFRAWDDTTSIPALSPSAEIAPQENLAVGLSTRLSFTKRLHFRLEMAGSFLNRDTRLAVLDTLDEINPIKNLFTPKIGGQLLTAGNASLQYNLKAVSLRLTYKRVDPDYRSLGAFYQQSDLQSLTLDPSFRMFRNKFRLSGSIGRQQDNLYRRKSFTSLRTIGSATATYAPSKDYSISASMANYGIQQQAGLQVLNDTFRVAQANRSVSLSQNISRSDKKRVVNLNTTISYQQLQDLNPFNTYSSSENTVWFGNIYVNRVRLKDNLNLNGGINFSHNTFASGNFILAGPSLGVSKPIKNNKIVLNGNLNYNLGFQNGNRSGSTLNLYTGASWQVSRSHQFTVTLNTLHNSTNYLSSGKFTEIRLLAGYVLLFQPKS